MEHQAPDNSSVNKDDAPRKGSYVAVSPDALMKEICTIPRGVICDDLESAVLLLIPEELTGEEDSPSSMNVEQHNLPDHVQRFTFDLSPEELKCLRENETSSGFQRGWSDVMADKLLSIWPTCALTFKNSHRCKTGSKKHSAAFWTPQW